MPLLVVDPGNVDVGEARTTRSRLEAFRNWHRDSYSGRENVEGSRLDILGHEEVDIARIQGVEDDARSKYRGNEASVGDSSCRDMEAHGDGKYVEEKVQTLSELVADSVFEVHHGEGDERRSNHGD